MAWAISYTKTARAQLKKLPLDVASRIVEYMSDRVAVAPNSPRELGKALQGGGAGFWRYRVGDYRVICALRDKELLVLVLKIGHRREVYRDL